MDNEGLAALAHLSDLSDPASGRNAAGLERWATKDYGTWRQSPSLLNEHSGQGFTDEALPYLKAMPKLRWVHDHGNWLSDRAIEELRQQRME